MTQKPITLESISGELKAIRADMATKKTTLRPSATASISITAAGFEPAVLSVKKGTKIRWTNNDKAMHQVIANPHPSHDSLPGLKSEILNEGQTYEYVAGQSGSFGYHDEVNPTINATVEVAE